MSICTHPDTQKGTRRADTKRWTLGTIRKLAHTLHPDSCFLNPNNRKMKRSAVESGIRVAELRRGLCLCMNIDPQPKSLLRNRASDRRLCLKVGTLLLLVAIAGFSTLAKNSQYFSKSNPAHYINISSKMKTTALPAVIDREPIRHVARFTVPPPQTRMHRVLREEIPSLPSIAVTVSLQHRSPPVFLA
jgi:hypothetical protein